MRSLTALIRSSRMCDPTMLTTKLILTWCHSFAFRGKIKYDREGNNSAQRGQIPKARLVLNRLIIALPTCREFVHSDTFNVYSVSQDPTQAAYVLQIRNRRGLLTWYYFPSAPTTAGNSGVPAQPEGTGDQKKPRRVLPWACASTVVWFPFTYVYSNWTTTKCYNDYEYIVYYKILIILSAIHYHQGVM